MTAPAHPAPSAPLSEQAKRYRQASFVTSAANLRQAPPDIGFEVAFAGRSNSGKSSAINALCNQNRLARISKTPGRTRLLNFFELDAQRRLVDLPGYGFAKVSTQVASEWRSLIEDYLSTRRSLRGMVLLMDIRHPMTDQDAALLQWNRHSGLATHILLTKSDKLSRGAGLQTLHRIRRTLHEHASVSIQLFSSLSKSGLEECYEVLDAWLGVDREEQSPENKNPGIQGGRFRG